MMEVGQWSVMLMTVLIHNCVIPAKGIIVQSPENQTVYLGSQAVFSCEIDRVRTVWKVNNTLIDNLPEETQRNLDRSQYPSPRGFSLLLLTIRAKVKWNMTRIQCVTGRNSSDIVFMVIQGHLASVGHLVASMTSIKLSWEAPFSLKVTDDDGDPDIWYSVSIYNVSDDTDPTVIPCTDCNNVTDTEYTFIPDYFNSSHQYNITVTPYNKAGWGEITTITFHEEHNDRVDVQRTNGNVDVRCLLKQASWRKCYISLEKIEIRSREERCVEEDTGASGVFTGVDEGSYIVRVYGMTEDSSLCSSSGEPNYITLIRHNPTLLSPSPATSNTQKISSKCEKCTSNFSHNPTLLSPSPATSNTQKFSSKCEKCISNFVTGLGIGAVVGTVATSLLCLVAVLFIAKCHRKREGVMETARRKRSKDIKKIAVDMNMAYELHTLKHCSNQQPVVPIYEEMK